MRRVERVLADRQLRDARYRAYASVGLDPGAKLDGRALALNAAVTLSGSNSVSVCSGGGPFPPFPSECRIKVTGGGQIPVPDGTKGRLNYLNHVTGLGPPGARRRSRPLGSSRAGNGMPHSPPSHRLHHSTSEPIKT